MTAPLLLALMALAGPAPAPPKPVGPPAATSPLAAVAAKRVPASIQADVIRYSWTTRKVRMEGKPFVTITREEMVLTCRRLVGDTDTTGDVARATCEGDVKLVRGSRTVTCDRAQYDRDAARVVCEGSPLLKDGDTEARGRKLTYLLAADEVLLEEAVQATVPSEQLDQVQRKPAPGAAAKGPAPKAPPPRAAPAPARPAGGAP